MKKTVVVFLLFIWFAQACAPATPTPTESPVIVTEAPVIDTAARLEELGGYPCPDSDFTCVRLTVPLDHFDSQDSRTMVVVFGVLPATGERKGMFVTATGGPPPPRALGAGGLNT